MVVLRCRDDDPVSSQDFFIKLLKNRCVRLVIGLIKHRHIDNLQNFNISFFGKLLLHELQKSSVIGFGCVGSNDAD